jgi:hypothetical protein
LAFEAGLYHHELHIDYHRVILTLFLCKPSWAGERMGKKVDLWYSFSAKVKFIHSFIRPSTFLVEGWSLIQEGILCKM